MVWASVTKEEERRRKRENDPAGLKEWDCSHYPQSRPSTLTQPDPGPTSLRLTRHCGHTDVILEEIYKDLVCEHKIMSIGILLGTAWPYPLSWEGDLGGFLPDILDDHMQDVHTV